MLVTDIKKIDDKRSCLYLDYEAFGPLYASDIRRLKLTVGSETDAEKMQQFRSEYFFKRAMNKAVTAIKYSEKCEYDIRQKLKELCYDEEVIDTTLDKLKKYKNIETTLLQGAIEDSIKAGNIPTLKADAVSIADNMGRGYNNSALYKRMGMETGEDAMYLDSAKLKEIISSRIAKFGEIINGTSNKLNSL